MEREILFRAKSKDLNLMVHGFYFYSELEDRNYIIGESKDYGFQKIEIDKNTLGQYTGLKDKNGVKIFEGDITDIGLISFRDGSFVLVHNPKTRSEIEGECTTDYLDQHCVNCYNLEIIGNIHEKNN